MSIDNSNAVVSIQGDLSANTFRIGSFNPTSISAIDISATNISAAILYTSNIIGTGIGTLTLGSSSLNPSAVIISDSDTQIPNLSLPNTIRLSSINAVATNTLAIALLGDINTVFNASIQPYTIAITPFSGDIYDLSNAGIYTIEPESNPSYTLIVNKPGRYIVCNQGWNYSGTPYTSMSITVQTNYGTSPVVSTTIIRNSLVNLQQTLTFDVYLGTIYFPPPADPAIVPGLVGANIVVADIGARM
jgi:hypothetical protein